MVEYNIFYFKFPTFEQTTRQLPLNRPGYKLVIIWYIFLTTTVFEKQVFKEQVPLWDHLTYLFLEILLNIVYSALVCKVELFDLISHLFTKIG